MKGIIAQSTPLLEYAVVSVPMKGEEESGDLHLVKKTPRGALVAVVDGSGHGAEAASAAQLAVSTLEAHAAEGVIPLVRQCHTRLRRTRGAVMSLVAFDGIENTITWLGVGNIEGLLLRCSALTRDADAVIFLQPGVVGYRLPQLQAAVTPITPGDLLILTTDGIRGDFARAFSLDDQPSKIAEYISSNFPKGNDDVLVLVARYLGQKQ